jgi:hypothetical protein
MAEKVRSEIPFEREHPNAYDWTKRAYDLLQDGGLDGHVHRRSGLETATVVGLCPRCNHTFSFDSSPIAIGTGGRTLGNSGPPAHDPPDDDEFVPIDVTCTCTAEHPGRQAAEFGCGITFRIEVRPEDHGG